MFHKKLRTTDGWLRVAIPTMLSEITLGQMMEMQNNPSLNDVEAISILSGIAVAELKLVKHMDDFKVFGDHVQSLAHQLKYRYDAASVPANITFIINQEPVTVKVIQNLSVEPAGAFMAARDIIADEISAHIERYGEEDWKTHFHPSLKASCMVLAHYFYCQVTGNKYSEYGAEAFSEEVKKLRVTEALPIARHFFMNYPCLSIRKTSFFTRLQTSWKKRQASERSKNLSISTPSTPWPTAT